MIPCSALLITMPLAFASAPVAYASPCPTSSGPASVCPQTDDDPADLLQDILDEYQEEYGKFMRAYRATDDQAERDRLRETLPDPEAYAQRVLALTSEHPGSEVAWDGLTWIVGRARGAACAADALVRLIGEFTKDERLGDICLRTGRGPFSEDVAKALGKLAKKSPHTKVRGQATFALGMQYKGLENQKGFLKQMKIVQKKFAEVPYFRGTLGPAAEGAIFEVERLQIGMTAPDIKGADLGGDQFALADYRGKVVVIDFWGHW